MSDSASTGRASFAAIDLGASSGRVIIGRVGPGVLEMTEVARFRNGPVALPDGLYWDILGLYQDILTGLRDAAMKDPEIKGLAIDSWAVEFDSWVAEQIQNRALEKLLDYRRTAPHARLSVPTTEHFDPLFVTLGASYADEPMQTIFEGFQYGNLSMRSFHF